MYDESGSSLFPEKIPVGFIYTMGADETTMKLLGIDAHINLNKMLLGRIFGSSESLAVWIPINLMIIPNMYHQDLMKQTKQKDAKKFFHWTAGKPSIWE